MKKLEKFTIISWTIILFFFMLSVFGFRFSSGELKIVFQFSIYTTLCAFIILVIGCFIGLILVVICRGYHNLSHCDLDCFENIDRIKRCGKSTNNNLKRVIEYINYSYQYGGVSTVISKKEIMTLYQRKDFLDKEKSFGDDARVYFSSLIISIMASILILFFDEEKIIFLLPISLLSELCFCAIIFLKYYQRGEMNAFYQYFTDFELRLLESSIQKIENDFKVAPGTEQFVLSIHNVFEELFYESSKARGKRKDEIKEDIENIQSLNLELVGDFKYETKKYMVLSKKRRKTKRIKPQPVYIAYIVDKNDNSRFAKEDFNKLYDIIKKHNLLVNT